MWIHLALALAAERTIPVQGSLADANGAPVVGAHPLTVTLWRGAPGSLTQVAESTSTVTFVAGAFSAGVVLDDALAATGAPAEWVTVTWGGTTSDPTPIGFAAAALYASSAGAIAGETLADLDDRYARFGATSAQAGDLELGGAVRAASVRVTGAITAADQLIPRSLLDAALASYLPKSGGTLTGALTLAGAPTAPLQAATKAYVDDAVASLASGNALSNYLPLTGGTLTGALSGTSATLSGTVSAAGATLTGGLTGTSGSFSGALSGASAAISGAISGASGTITNLLTVGRLRLSSDTTTTCDASANGVLRYNGANFQGCNGSTWISLDTVKDGGSQDRAAPSCLSILQNGFSVGNGAYWIDPNGGSSVDALRLFCVMDADGGGWTLVSKTNAADKAHCGNQQNTGNLADLSTSTSGYVGDTFRRALGTCYRVTITAGQSGTPLSKYGLITNTKGFNEWWGGTGPTGGTQAGIFWSDTYQTTAGGYTLAGLDDANAAGGTYGPGYQGGNWCHVTANGTRMFDTSLGYVKSGYMLVKSCVP